MSSIQLPKTKTKRRPRSSNKRTKTLRKAQTKSPTRFKAQKVETVIEEDKGEKGFEML
jgi:hypothetical protein